MRENMWLIYSKWVDPFGVYLDDCRDSRSTITGIIKKFYKTGSVHNVIRKNKELSQKEKMPYQSSRWSSQKTHHCRSDIYYRLLKFHTRLILKDDLDLKPYKLPDFHELQTADFPKRFL
jgi:hypothetical protein